MPRSLLPGRGEKAHSGPGYRTLLRRARYGDAGNRPRVAGSRPAHRSRVDGGTEDGSACWQADRRASTESPPTEVSLWDLDPFPSPPTCGGSLMPSQETGAFEGGLGFAKSLGGQWEVEGRAASVGSARRMAERARGRALLHCPRLRRPRAGTPWGRDAHGP